MPGKLKKQSRVSNHKGEKQATENSKMRSSFEFWIFQGKNIPAMCVQVGQTLITETVKLNEWRNQLEMVKQSTKQGVP